jgi:dephospho-CoA kinase
MKIALTGKMRSGKDTVGDYLAQEYEFTRFAFGDELKRYAHELFGDSKAKQRELYQWFGQTMRQRDGDIWVRKCFDRIRYSRICPVNGDDNLRPVITDLRQPNEYERCRADGFAIIRVTAPDELRLARAKEAGDQFTAADLTHETESHIDGFAVDYEFVNDGTKAELLRKVDELISGIVSRADSPQKM